MEVDTNGMGETNGHAHENGHHKEKRRETSEERRIRKDKERKARENETEEERRIRKEKEKLNSSKHKETEEERRIRKEKEKQNGGGEKRKETEEERRIRKEKEKAAGGKKEETEEERRIRKNKERGETEEERKIRKEKERAEKENGKRKETEEERRIRKEKEKNGEKRKETEEERRIRKEKEKSSSRKETEEERRIRKEKERKEKKHETEEERYARKERERKERKEKEKAEENKEEMMELGDDYFAAEEERLNQSKNHKADVQSEEEAETTMEQEEREEEEEEEERGEEQGEEEEAEEPEEADEKPEVKMEEESDDDTKQGITMQPVDSDDDLPLARRKKPAVKRKVESGDESDDEPLSKKVGKAKKAVKREPSYDDYEDEEDDYQRPSKKMKKPAAKKGGTKKEKAAASPTKKQTKKEKEMEEEKKVWKWWEEDNVLPEGVKWRFLEHKGPMFAPAYTPLPPEVRFWYDGKILRLTEETEECATFYGRMLDHDYTTKEVFNKNFFKDWRKTMTEKEKDIIRDLSKCDFSEIDAHFKKMSEERKNRSKDEKNKEKEYQASIVAEYGLCNMDGHMEKIGNFRTEPPSLFRGRGEHPKQGMIKRRIMPEDVIINCSKDSAIPQPPEGHKWKKVQHDNTVTWLASWTENIQGQIKYIMLNPSSRLKGEKDWQKYEKARTLKGEIGKIRDDYMADMKSKEMRVRQRAVALYFIDKLALRAGNEKDSDEQADTVGCCSLRVEHIELHEQKDGKEWVVEFDFLGKDSIRYNNDCAVDKKVFKNVKLFMENKKDGDDLFDRLNTSVLNQYLNSLMDGLTAKVFRTYNASFTLQNQLDELTEKDDNVAAKMLAYNRANRAVAVLCNHQRAVPKTHEKSMENLDGKLQLKQEAIKAAEKNLKHAKKAYKNNGSQGEKAAVDKCKKVVERLLEQLEKLEIQKTDKDENKTISLGTSKLNYLDPRISVQWCKTHEVPLEKVYNKTHREKFRWAIDMIMNSDDTYHF